MKCQNCGAELAEGAMFCTECGEKVSKPIRYCTECGKQLPEGSQFCPECGAIVKNLEADIDKDSSVSEKGDYSSDLRNSGETENSNKTTGSTNVETNQRIEYKANQSSAGKNKKAPNIKLPLILLVGIAVVLIIILALSKACSSDNSSSEKDSKGSSSLTANSVFDVITPEVSDSATLDLGVEYAYMSDDRNVYIAKAVTDNVVKVERWNKISQSKKSLEYKNDLGSFRIREEENGFFWLDDSHTAFTLVIQDKDNSEVKDPTLVIFTIDISDSDNNKGTDFDDSIACYTYVINKNYTYRAIPLTDTLVKVECWYRMGTGIFDSHRFAWDVGIINTEKTATDFEWDSNDHNSFAVTMKDPANKYDWKEEQLASFILENKNYKYATVKDYLDGIKKSDKGESESATTEVATESTEEVVPTEATTEIPTESAETTEEPVTTTEPETTQEPETESITETTTEPETVYYSTNTKDTVKDGNKGVYAYKSRGGSYENYYIIDFDEGYVYFFSDGNGEETCDKVKIVSGDLNDVLIITYHDEDTVWSEGLHFKFKRQPDHLIMQMEDGTEFDFYEADLKKALEIRDRKKIYEL